jgi:hypothetical protein
MQEMADTIHRYVLKIGEGFFVRFVPSFARPLRVNGKHRL